MTFRIWIMIGVSFFFTIPAGAGQDFPAPHPDELIREALQNNPELAAARHDVAANAARIGQAGAWDPPQIGFEFFQTPVDAFPNPVKDSMEIDYYVQQMIPFPGKLSAMTESAKSNSQMVEHGYNSLERKIIRDLKTSYYTLYLVQRKIGINAENQCLVREFTDIAGKRYEVGMGNQADILRSQTELSSLINDGANLLEEEKMACVQLNAVLNRSPEKPVGRIIDIVKQCPEFAFEPLKTLAVITRPELNAMRKNIDMNQAELQAARQEYYPDLMFRVMYKDMADTSKDFWSTMFSVTVPLASWSAGKYRGKVAENLEKIEKARQDLRAMETQLDLQIQEALIGMRTNLNSMALYERTIIPQAKQTLLSTRSAYQTGTMEFFALIEAYRTLLDARLSYHMSAMGYMTSQAALEQAVGLSVEQIEERSKVGG